MSAFGLLVGRPDGFGDRWLANAAIVYIAVLYTAFVAAGVWDVFGGHL